MPMMFFYFLKIIFDISTSKRSKKYKPHLILAKKKIEIRSKTGSTAEPNSLKRTLDGRVPSRSMHGPFSHVFHATLDFTLTSSFTLSLLTARKRE